MICVRRKDNTARNTHERILKGRHELFGLVGITGIGFAGHVQDGFGTLRFDAEILAAFDAATTSPDRGKCHSRAPSAACQYNIQASRKVTVLGDSHAVELTYSLAKMLEEYDYSVTHLSRSGCPPALTFKTNVNGCTSWTTSAVNSLADSVPHTVVLVYRHALYLYGENAREFVTYPTLPVTPFSIQALSTADATRSAYWSSFQTMVTRLLSAGHNVIIVQPFPEISRPIKSYLLHSEYDVETSSIISISRAYYDARTVDIRQHMIALAKTRKGVEVFDPLPVFCDAQNCYAMSGGVPLYFDADHPSVAGADLIAANLIGSILKSQNE